MMNHKNWISREVKNQISAELPDEFGREDCNRLSIKYGVASNSVKNIGERSGKKYIKAFLKGKNRLDQTTMTGTGVKKYTNPDHLQFDEQVEIVSVVNPFDNYQVGKKGVFLSHRNGNITVELDEGGFVVADKVYALRQAKKKRVFKTKPMGKANRAFLRFVMDYYHQNYDHLTMKKISKIFGLNQTSLYTWWGQYRKDKDSFTRYTPEEAESWSKQYGISEEPEKVDEPVTEVVTEEAEEVQVISSPPKETAFELPGGVEYAEVFTRGLYGANGFNIQLDVHDNGRIVYGETELSHDRNQLQGLIHILTHIDNQIGKLEELKALQSQSIESQTQKGNENV